MKLYFDSSEFVPGSTLIFLDEIQECAKARTSLKWFAESGEYDVIASGSMLGVADSMSGSGESVPVRYEQIVEMKALDFEEFLNGFAAGACVRSSCSRKHPRSAVQINRIRSSPVHAVGARILSRRWKVGCRSASRFRFQSASFTMSYVIMKVFSDALKFLAYSGKNLSMYS